MNASCVTRNKKVMTMKNLQRKERIIANAICIAFVCFMALMMVEPAFASYTSTITTVLDDLIDIVATIFQAIGAVTVVVAIAQFILASKNEDSNAQSAAIRHLVVGAALIAVPGIIKALDITSLIGTT